MRLELIGCRVLEVFGISKLGDASWRCCFSSVVGAFFEKIVESILFTRMMEILITLVTRFVIGLTVIIDSVWRERIKVR